MDIVDHFITHYGLVIIGVIECFLIGWLFKASRLREHITHAGENKLNGWWDICVRFITPLVLTGLLINDLIGEVSKPYEGYSWIAILLIGRDWLVAALIVSLFIAMRPWKKQIEELED